MKDPFRLCMTYSSVITTPGAKIASDYPIRLARCMHSTLHFVEALYHICNSQGLTMTEVSIQYAAASGGTQACRPIAARCMTGILYLIQLLWHVGDTQGMAAAIVRQHSPVCRLEGVLQSK